MFALLNSSLLKEDQSLQFTAKRTKQGSYEDHVTQSSEAHSGGLLQYDCLLLVS